MHQKWIKIGLLLLLVVAALAVFVSIYSRFDVDVAEETELLSPNISRRSTDFDYSEYKLGRLVFRVMSRSHALDSQGIEQLEDVELVIHDESGTAADSISAQNAVYDVERKTINFFGTVRIDLKDGAVVTCDRVFADLARQEIRIEEEFEFSREGASGTGGSLLYSISRRLLEVDDSFQVSASTESGELLQATAERGVYYADQSRITLVGKSRLAGLGYRLLADQIRMEMTAQHSLKQVVAQGRSRLIGPQRTFEGQRIIAGFDPVERTLTDFRVIGSVEGAAPKLANYEERSERAEYSLKSERIVFFPVAGKADKWSLAISRFKASDNVQLLAPALGIDRASCGFLNAEFGPQESLRQLEFRTKVVVERRTEEEQKRLEAESLVVDLDDSGQITGVMARRNVVLKTEKAGSGQRQFSAKSDLRADFVKGQPARVVGRGGCVFEATGGGEEIQTRAPLVTADFEEGLISQIETRGGTELDYVKESERTRTSSVTGLLAFDKGALSRVTQSHEFELRGTVGLRPYRLKGERAVFEQESQAARVTGQPPPKLTIWETEEARVVLSETVARRFELDRSGGTVIAVGEVQTFVNREVNPITITAGRMKMDSESGWIQYNRSPEIIEGSNRITGETVRYNPDEQRLLVQDNVRSLLVAVTDKGQEEATITADLLRFDQEAGKARYEGQVQAKIEDMVLLAPFLELLFDGITGENRSTVREVKAWGGVKIREPGREAIGDTAFYYPADSKVMITGDQAEVTDDQQGKAFGRQLTFYLGEERLTIEGPPIRKP